MQQMIGVPIVANDIDNVALSFGLAKITQSKLTAIVIGAISGNRDLPLYSLARSIKSLYSDQDETAAVSGLFQILADCQDKRTIRLNLLQGALLDFLAFMDDAAHFNNVELAIARLTGSPDNPDAVRDCASALAACLYRYRRDHLPGERYRAKFTDLRRYLSGLENPRKLPEDGDALDFWCQTATRKKWTLFENVFDAMRAFVETAEIEAASIPAGSWNVHSDEDTSRKNWEDIQLQALGTYNLEDRLDTAIAELAGSDLKIFKDSELRIIRKVAGMGHLGYGWARSGLTLLAIAPFQASIVQLEKMKGQPERILQACQCASGPDYDEILTMLEDRLNMIGEVRTMAEALSPKTRSAGAPKTRSAGGKSENQPEASKVTSTSVYKESKLMRRKSFKSINPDRLSKELAQLRLALTDLDRHTGLILRRWMSQTRNQRTAIFQVDRQRFSEKLARLYLSNRNDMA